jgi:hypothetical protein
MVGSERAAGQDERMLAGAIHDLSFTLLARLIIFRYFASSAKLFSPELPGL